MKNKAIGFILLVFIWGGLASAFGWIVGGKKEHPKQKEVLIDSLKIDSITIKIYRNGRTD